MALSVGYSRYGGTSSRRQQAFRRQVLCQFGSPADEVLCARWIENPYYQYFCGELSFCHRLPFDRSSMTRWRQRLGEEQLVALIQESLSVAY